MPEETQKLSWYMKAIGWVIDKKLGTPKIQETVKKSVDMTHGWKTHVLGAITALTAIVGMIDTIQKLTTDGLQFADIVVISNDPHIYAFLIGLGLMTGRSAITRLGEQMKAKKEGMPS